MLLSEQAEAALLDLQLWIHRQSGFADRAHAFVEDIRSACRKLGDTPHLGTVRGRYRTVGHKRRATIVFLVDEAARSVTVIDILYRGRQPRLTSDR